MFSFSSICTEVMLNKYQLSGFAFHIVTCCKFKQKNHWRELKRQRVWVFVLLRFALLLILLMKIFWFVSCDVLMIINRLVYNIVEGENISALKMAPALA